MLEELEVLKTVSERLQRAQIPFMLTGSFAMAYYGQPRMTRDLDLVVSLAIDDIPGLVTVLSPDFYIDARAGTWKRCSLIRWTANTCIIGPHAWA